MMRRILVVYCIGLLSWTTCHGAREDVKPGHWAERDVSVFQVSWQCPAAPAIGCGSRAKPVLLELERDPRVREAWLNRQGTLIAVIWNPDAKPKARRTVEKSLKAEEASKLGGTAKAKALAEFESGKDWYRGSDVDRLSEEEAGIIAARWVRRLQAKTTLAHDKAEGLEAALADGLRKCLTGCAVMPQGADERAAELRRVAGPFLDDEQLKILSEAAQCGMRPLPNER